MTKSRFYLPVLCFFLYMTSFFTPASAQMITGTWHGKINRQKVEIKIIQSGDSLTGTSYYYESASNYRRYSIKGYFDPNTNSAIWWDDRLIEERSTKFSLSSPGKIPLLSEADFNCPGGSRMYLNGNVSIKGEEPDKKGEVHLEKDNRPQFEDEWDFVVDNYTVGANDRDIIDSVANLSVPKVVTIARPNSNPQESSPSTTIARPVQQPQQEKPPTTIARPVEKPKEEHPVVTIARPVEKPKEEPPVVTVKPVEKPKEEPVVVTPAEKPKEEVPQVTITEPEPIKPVKPVEAPVEKPVARTIPGPEKPKDIAFTPQPVKVPSIEEKFKAREKKFMKEIPVTGDSIELRFYDNAEVDGDSISLFLNDSLLFQHIRLTEKAYTIKIPVSLLKSSNELTMVAENLGSIPPNTSYMVAIVEDKRYDAYLASTEGSSAMVRLTKK